MLRIDDEVKARYAGIDALMCRVANVLVHKKNLELDRFKEEATEEVKGCLLYTSDAADE